MRSPAGVPRRDGHGPMPIARQPCARRDARRDAGQRTRCECSTPGRGRAVGSRDAAWAPPKPAMPLPPLRRGHRRSLRRSRHRGFGSRSSRVRRSDHARGGERASPRPLRPGARPQSAVWPGGTRDGLEQDVRRAGHARAGPIPRDRRFVLGRRGGHLPPGDVRRGERHATGRIDAPPGRLDLCRGAADGRNGLRT